MLIILIPSVAIQRQTASFVFTSFNVPTDLDLPSDPYIFLVGLLMSQYGLAGFDASAHMVGSMLETLNPKSDSEIDHFCQLTTIAVTVLSNCDFRVFKAHCCS